MFKYCDLMTEFITEGNFLQKFLTPKIKRRYGGIYYNWKTGPNFFRFGKAGLGFQKSVVHENFPEIIVLVTKLEGSPISRHKKY